jgi:hypothetical protein
MYRIHVKHATSAQVVDEAFGAGTQQRIRSTSLCLQLQAVETRAGIPRLPRCMANADLEPFGTAGVLDRASISRYCPLGFEVSGSLSFLLVSLS